MGDGNEVPAAGGLCGWVKMWHPCGVLVTLPVGLAGVNYKSMHAAVSDAVTAGFLANMPGIEPGERFEDIGFVVRRSKLNKETKVETPLIDLYPANPRATFSVLSIYLNTPEDVRAFEAVSGLSTMAIPHYVGSNKITRGENPNTDKLVVPTKKVARVVLKDNPKYDPNEKDMTKKKPARLFVRWDGLAPPVKKEAPPASEHGNKTAAERAALAIAYINKQTDHNAVVAALNKFEGLNLGEVATNAVIQAAMTRESWLYSESIKKADTIEAVDAVLSGITKSSFPAELDAKLRAEAAGRQEAILQAMALAAGAGDGDPDASSGEDEPAALDF